MIWGFRMFWFCIGHKQSTLEVLTLKNDKLFAWEAFALLPHTEPVWTIMFRDSNIVDCQTEDYLCEFALIFWRFGPLEVLSLKNAILFAYKAFALPLQYEKN